MDFHLKTIMRSAKSYIKDTGDFLNKLKEFGSIPKNVLLVTVHVVGLYPSMPDRDGLGALPIKLEQWEDKKIPTEDLLKMAQFVQKNNYFEFNSKVKQQVSCTAIGTMFAPPYAYIFMEREETESLEKERLEPWVWLRYIDNIFFVWTHGEDKLDEFLQRLNSFHPNLKFTSKRSEQKINFLDITVQLSNKKFVTDLYCKPTDCHQYLHYNSCHPEHMKKSSVYSKGLRINGLCSEDTTLANHLKYLKSWIWGRDYQKNMVTEQLVRVKHRNRENLPQTNDCVSKEI